MPKSEDSEDEGPPKSSFEIYRAEGEALMKNGEYRKSIECYTMALELKQGDRGCLVKRSHCYLKLGDTEKALADAEATLAEEKTYHKGIYQKAETLYSMGDFEQALVFYHRGLQLRPGLEQFRLGIQKAEESIRNSVGKPDSVALTKEGDLSYFYKQDESKQKQKQFRPVRKEQEKGKDKERVKSQLDEKTVKQLLGELYEDRDYLERLLHEEDEKNKRRQAISGSQNEQKEQKQARRGRAAEDEKPGLREAIISGLNYLDKRSEFWQQQRPMYARKRDQQRTMDDALAKGTPDSEARHVSNPPEYIVQRLEEIDELQSQAEWGKSLKLAKRTLEVAENFKEKDLPKRPEFFAALHSYIGNAYLELEQYEESIEHHRQDFDLGRANKLDDAISRGMDNLGRVYQKMGRFDTAARIWQEKLQLSKSTTETCWLSHEIGRCFLELKKYEQAHDYAEKAVQAAEESGDLLWQMNTNALLAQIELASEDCENAVQHFETALKVAEERKDENAAKSLDNALAEARQKQREAQDKNAEVEQLAATAGGAPPARRPSRTSATGGDTGTSASAAPPPPPPPPPPEKPSDAPSGTGGGSRPVSKSGSRQGSPPPPPN